MAAKNVGPGKEFFSDWHLAAYIEAKERELLGALARGDEEAEAECRRELKRLGAAGSEKALPKAVEKA